ncbi:hypothetical protein JG688_00014354 [Phytophthora aleatoria]|uniref:Uncharacterized protein n=1 Tax=Phytophthora aleatoria TaxID=2496075 RepID=A0A8J5IVL0_9STRA|nr:hypothetical protein JG688_00014354 [Phytophthora aleatoria]
MSDDISCSAFRVQNSHMKSLKHVVLNGSTKWRTGMDIAERVVEAMSSQGTRSFLGMVEALRKLGECASQGTVPTIVNLEGSLSFTSSKVTSSAFLLLSRRFLDSSDDEDGEDSYNRESFDSLAVKAAGNEDVPVETIDMKGLVDTTADNKISKTQSTKELKQDRNLLVKTSKELVKNSERTTIRKRNTDDHNDKDASSSSEKEGHRFEIIKSITRTS